MSEWGKREQAAMRAVARHLSATGEEGGGSPDAHLRLAGERIAVEVTTLPQSKGGDSNHPRLRFDKVVLRLVGGLQAALGEVVPDGQAVMLTVTAPIRLPGKTAAALESKIRNCLARRSAKVGIEETIHGNQVRLRIVKGVSAKASKVIGFVHNPETDAEALLDLTQSLLQQIGTAADKPMPKKFTSDRWLVIANEDGFPHIETYRQAQAQLFASTGFNRILMVLAGGRVEPLTG